MALPTEEDSVDVVAQVLTLLFWGRTLHKQLFLSTTAAVIALNLLILLPFLQVTPLHSSHIARAANGTSYYVSTNGRDSNNGNQQAPFRTIQHAVDRAKAGDTIYVRGGTYHENIKVDRSGTAANPIRLLAFSGETPTIDGQYTLPTGAVANCSNVVPKHCFVYDPLVSLNGNYLEFSGFKIIRSRGRGIGINPLADSNIVSNILIDGCVIDGTRNASINIQDAKYVTVQHCNVTHGANFATHSRSASELNWPVIVNILRSDNITVRRSKIHENWGEGIAAGRDSTNVTIEDNIIYDNYALQVYIHRAQDVVAQRNLIYHTNAADFRRGGNPSDCIAVNNEGSFMDSLVTERIRIINNVVTGCGRGIAVWGNAGLNITTQDVEITQNTVVHAVKNSGDDPVGIFVNAKVPLRNILIHKNIVLQNDGRLASMPSSSQISLRSNLWSSTPINSASSATDYIGAPGLISPNRTLYPDEVQIDWFKPRSDSPALSRNIGPSEYLDQSSMADLSPPSSPGGNPLPGTTTPLPDPDAVESTDIYRPDAFYTFDEGGGSRIPDKGATRFPINLTIDDASAVVWQDDGLTIRQPTTIRSSGSAANLMSLCRRNNELSVSLWMTPANVTQDGPARIISFSSDATHRNFMIGQGLWDNQPSELVTVRLRTTQTNDNGEPSLESPADTIRRQKHHVVFSRGREGKVHLYVDGILQASATVSGTFSNWSDSYAILLANEATGDRPWLGTYHQLALYCGALTKADVAELFDAAEDVPLPSLARPDFFSNTFLPLVAQ